MIAVVDYGMGNLRSVQKGLEKVGCGAVITSDPREVLKARGVVLPGVGAFARAMENLQDLGLIGPLQQVARRGTPLLGICLGLQLLFTAGEEDGEHPGLDILPGRVVRFPAGSKIPHMGWNHVVPTRDDPVFSGILPGTPFYFVHAYYAVPRDPEVVLATTEYSVNFASAVAKDVVYGVQFHPEKSSGPGLKLLQNFGELVYGVGYSGH